MKFKKHDIVISKKDVIEHACGDHPAFLLCSKGQKLKIMKLFSKKDYPKHGKDSYAVKDLLSKWGDFFIDEDELGNEKV